MPALHPDAEILLQVIRESGRPSYASLEPAEARRMYRDGRHVLQLPPPEVAVWRDLDCDGPRGKVPLRLYRGLGTAAEAALPCLLYLHGGGWVFGDLDTHDGLCRALANEAGCCVIAVDYRMAPEHRFPAAVEDAMAALRFVAAEASSLGIDPSRLAVGGDSAGGNLAAILALLGRDGAVPNPGFQLLLYPATDLTMTTESYERITAGLPLTAEVMRWFIDHYAPEVADRWDWRASPLRAPSLAGVAPAFVMTAGHDPLNDEGRAYADRLEREGVRVAHLHCADQIHGFLTMGRFLRGAATVTRIAALALREAWEEFRVG
ncbi:alpha/beta hydrolase [Roseomonas sp. NAR14]|uniref:Alpha/beta hydrolase n=1 Tax=Roseomonas acroporae TaxID=2937791 RepID=A0A9X1Y4U6_9PROT|nr:alpha/beta hydrolase [Roseomonas acroporae]MCK8784234.1 alpha/beta hydrolase [Roseomonas acroporae]